MNSILRQTGAVALALGLLASPVLAAGPAGTPAPGAGPNDAAGAIGVPGANSVTGPNAAPVVQDQLRKHADDGSTVGKSQAELPNNDAGTPINNGPHGVGKGSMNGDLNPPNALPHE